ncbi:MAG: hypothetical protein HeimC3_17170 [Candidatus Heimdallarchaeota archaeon LC_3]|nr:MAG: hypothetical protein HeimC3_17170 [Candidatus Heimdallarchaeota archaeon LC_3]
MKTIEEYVERLKILNSRLQVNDGLIKEHETLLHFEFEDYLLKASVEGKTKKELEFEFVNNLENPEKLYSSWFMKNDIKIFVGTLRNSINRTWLSRQFFLGYILIVYSSYMLYSILEYYGYWNLLPIVYLLTVLLVFSPLVLHMIRNIFRNTLIEIRYQIITDFWIQSIFYTFLFLPYNVMLVSELELISANFTLLLRILVLLLVLFTYLLILGGKYFKSEKIFISATLIVNIIAIWGIYTLFLNLYTEYYSDFPDYLVAFNHEPSELISQIQTGIILLIMQTIFISVCIVLLTYIIIKLFDNMKESGKYFLKTQKMKIWIIKYPLIKYLAIIPVIIILALIQMLYYVTYNEL